MELPSLEETEDKGSVSELEVSVDWLKRAPGGGRPERSDTSSNVEFCNDEVSGEALGVDPTRVGEEEGHCVFSSSISTLPTGLLPSLSFILNLFEPSGSGDSISRADLFRLLVGFDAIGLW